MKLANLMNAAPAMPADWREDPALKEPARAVAAAQAAIAEADEKIDRAAALVVAIDADLAEVTDARAADALEDRRDEALKAHADGQRARERAVRALDRATKTYEPLTLAAQRRCAEAHRSLYLAAVADVVRDLGALRESAARLDALRERVIAMFPHDDTTASGLPTGLLPKAVGAGWNEPPILGIPGLLAKITGRRGQAIDHFLARLRDWRLL